MTRSLHSDNSTVNWIRARLPWFCTIKFASAHIRSTSAAVQRGDGLILQLPVELYVSTASTDTSPFTDDQPHSCDSFIRNSQQYSYRGAPFEHTCPLDSALRQPFVPENALGTASHRQGRPSEWRSIRSGLLAFLSPSLKSPD